MIDLIKQHFVPIHMHSDHSLGDGAQRVEDMAATAARYGYKACSLTDHGTMTGLYPFERACVEQGVRPLHGCEVYLDQTTTSGDIAEIRKRDLELRKINKGKEWTDKDRTQNRSHLVLLTKNDIGFRNLTLLNNLAIRDRALIRQKAIPLVMWSEVADRSEGLIASTACVASKLSALCIKDNAYAFTREIQAMHEVFGEDLFLELQLNSLPIQKKYNSWLRDAARAMSINLVLGLDAHYQRPQDGLLRQIVIASMYKFNLDKGQMIDDSGTIIVDPEWEVWFKSPEEIVESWNKHRGELKDEDFVDAIEGTAKIAERCKFSFKSLVTGYKMPAVNVDNPDQYLRDLVRAGLQTRIEQGFIKEHQAEAYATRAKRELIEIASKGYSSYFIATYQAVNQSKSEFGALVGPGRGSAAGSLVNFALGITSPDPIRFGLSFERFMNPARGKIVADLGV
tara:strand:+ start:4113 stop:5471 length:1359 start_codon:yes stop_codon:yes gene_type:complete